MFKGVIINFFAIIIGACLGMFLRKGFSREVQETLMKAMALCVFFIGVTGLMKSSNALVLIVSMGIGAIIGESLRLEQGFNRFAQKLQEKIIKNSGESTFAEGFVTASLLYCVGAMAIVGSFESGLSGNHGTLIAKALIDGIVSITLASSLGFGVAFSAFLVFFYQGTLTALAGTLQPLLSGEIIGDMTAIGSLLIIAMSLNMLKLTKIKILNLLPGVVVPIVYALLQAIV